MPTLLPRRNNRNYCDFFFPVTAAFSLFREDRLPRQSFGACSRFTLVAACRFANRLSATFVRKASNDAVARITRFRSYQGESPFPGQDFHLLDNSAFHGAPKQLRKKAKGGDRCETVLFP